MIYLKTSRRYERIERSVRPSVGNSAKVMTDDRDDGCGRRGAFLMVPTGILVVLLAVVGAYLWIEHRADLLGVILWLPLLACPLMHLLMHRGHGKHGPTHHSEKPR